MKNLFYMGLLSAILSSSFVYASDTIGSSSVNELEKIAGPIGFPSEYTGAADTLSEKYQILPSLSLTDLNYEGKLSVPFLNSAYMIKSKSSLHDKALGLSQMTLRTVIAFGVLLTLNALHGSAAH